MFHTQRLSLDLADLFPLPPVRLANLSQHLQSYICSQLSLSYHSNLILRPSQATTPMGFRWSVDIGHYAAQALISKSHRILNLRLNSTPIHPVPNFLCKRHAPFTLAIDRPLICHIIDDITIITVDWPKEQVQAWHRILRNLFTAALYPISLKKSCPLQTFIQDTVPLIGLSIDLLHGQVTPQDDKYNSLVHQLRSTLQQTRLSTHTWQNIIGKLCWYSTLHRPALSAFSLVYHSPRITDTSSTPPTSNMSTAQSMEVLQISSLIPFCSAALHPRPLPIITSVRVTPNQVTLYVASLQEHQAWNCWAIAHHQQRAQFTKTSVDIESAEILPFLPWKQIFSAPWKTTDSSIALHFSAAVIAMEHIVKKGHQNGFSFIITSHGTVANAIRKGRHSDRALLIRLRKLSALSFAANIQLLPIHMPKDPFTSVISRHT